MIPGHHYSADSSDFRGLRKNGRCVRRTALKTGDFAGESTSGHSGESVGATGLLRGLQRHLRHHLRQHSAFKAASGLRSEAQDARNTEQKRIDIRGTNATAIDRHIGVHVDVAGFGTQGEAVGQIELQAT